ncbi:MAG: hypothetical protein KC766_08870 [Myxococcales bacterium]|nr:hypothetical protein [Myxococcales bacterium]
MLTLLIAQLALAPVAEQSPTPDPGGLAFNLHAELVASPIVAMNGAGDDAHYSVRSGDSPPWSLGVRGVLGVQLAPSFELGLGASYSRLLGGHRFDAIGLELRATWLPLNLNGNRLGWLLGAGPLGVFEDGSDQIDEPDTLKSTGWELHTGPQMDIELGERTAFTLGLEGSYVERQFSNGRTYLKSAYVHHLSTSLTFGGRFDL